MNINTAYFLYTKSFKTTVLDRNTGISYAATFAYKTPATEEIMAAYTPFGGVGYLADEYNVFRIDETGEEFVYPFSFGYANPDEFNRQPVEAKYTVSPIGSPDEKSEPVSIEQAMEIAVKPVSQRTPDPFTRPTEHRAYVESQKREEVMRRSPLVRLAVELAGAIGQQQRETQLWLAMEIVRDTRWMHPQDQQARDCYNELKDALAQTEALLPDVRSFMRDAADGFGY